MADKISNNILAASLVLAIVISVVGLVMGIGNITGRGTTPGGTAQVTVNTETSCSLTTTAVDFTTIALGGSADTTGDSPHAFMLTNDGNININVTVTSATPTFLTGTSPTYEFNCTPNDGTCVISSWTSASTSAAQYFATLPFVDSADDIELEVNIACPADATPGAKSDVVTFTCSNA